LNRGASAGYRKFVSASTVVRVPQGADACKPNYQKQPFFNARQYKIL